MTGAATAALSVRGAVRCGQAFIWIVVFFFASAGASAGYLTVSEIFSIEIRAEALAVFFAIAQVVGAVGPAFYGVLIGNGGNRAGLAIGYLVGGGIMIIGGVVEALIGISTEGQAPGADRAAPHRGQHRGLGRPRGGNECDRCRRSGLLRGLQGGAAAGCTGGPLAAGTSHRGEARTSRRSARSAASRVRRYIPKGISGSLPRRNSAPPSTSNSTTRPCKPNCAFRQDLPGRVIVETARQTHAPARRARRPDGHGRGAGNGQPARPAPISLPRYDRAPGRRQGRRRDDNQL
jgi:hypothetical protein